MDRGNGGGRAEGAGGAARRAGRRARGGSGGCYPVLGAPGAIRVSGGGRAALVALTCAFESLEPGLLRGLKGQMLFLLVGCDALVGVVGTSVSRDTIPYHT